VPSDEALRIAREEGMLMTDRPPLHVRVVDGAAEVGKIVREVLEEEGYRVTVTTETPLDPGDNAPDGVDLVVVDPGSGGEDPGGWFRQHLEHDREAMDIPRVVCTGNTRMLRDLADDLEERTIDRVEKPFDLDVLLQVVDAHMGPSSAVSSSRAEGSGSLGLAGPGGGLWRS
jgi:DNA-binding response OmpR family regulator